MFKAKWINDNKNRIDSIYVRDYIRNKNGKIGKRYKYKMTRSNNNFTVSLDFLGKKMVESKLIDSVVWNNLQAMLEIRDSSTHFYNIDKVFALRLRDIGSASLQNYVTLIQEWFSIDLGIYNFYLMPLSFLKDPPLVDSVILTKEEENFIRYVQGLCTESLADESKYYFSSEIKFEFIKNKGMDAINVRISNDEDAIKIKLDDDAINSRYPLDYKKLCDTCVSRYTDFKIDSKFHDLRKAIVGDKKYCHIRKLNPHNPNSVEYKFFSMAILDYFDQHYTRRK